jgi:hypothetical protein
MIKKGTHEVVICDLSGCDVKRSVVSGEFVPSHRRTVVCTTIGGKGGEFCSPDCHGEAHARVAHGKKWRSGPSSRKYTRPLVVR